MRPSLKLIPDGECRLKYRFFRLQYRNLLIDRFLSGRIVEHGTLDDVYNHTRHPYTVGLFESLPNIEERDVKLKPIPGLMPDPSSLPSGCPFHPRCRYAMDICSRERPAEVHRSASHYTACHLFNEQNIDSEEVLV